MDIMTFNFLIISHIEDIMHDDLELLRKEEDRLIEELRAKGWTINKEKTHGPDISANFLGIR